MTIQEMINSGMAWRLEGFYGRQAMAAIENGDAILGIRGNTDFYGHYVPSRYQVDRGTKGSVQYANKLRKARNQRPLRGMDFDNGVCIRDER